MVDEDCPQSFLEHRTAIEITLRGTIGKLLELCQQQFQEVKFK